MDWKVFTDTLLLLARNLPLGRRTAVRAVMRLIPERAKQNVVAAVDGLKLSLDLREALDMGYFLGIWDRDEIEAIIKNIPKDGCFVDIGANQGFYSLMIAKSVPNSRIYAFEPDPYSALKFRKNISLNNLDNIVLVEKGISDSSRKLKLMINTAGNRGGSSVEISQTQWTGASNDVVVEIECLALSEAIRSFGIKEIDTMKIDIEGHEHSVLSKFFSDTPREFFPRLIVAESFEDAPYAEEKSVVRLLNENGFVKSFSKSNNHVFVSGITPSKFSH